MEGLLSWRPSQQTNQEIDSMKKYVMTTIICVFSALALAGCGGGGGGGGGGPVTKATTKIYLFGNITSAGNIVGTVKTTLNVPSGVLINYSSTPGATTGLCILRKGVIVPSGPVQVSASDFSGSSYDLTSRVLTLQLVNFSRAALKSGSSGNGKEIATINFSLATPGVLPSSMPVKDSLAEVGQEVLSTHATSYPLGSETNFETTYQ